MLAETFQSIATATRQLFRNWRSLLMLAAIYAALLATLYFFLTIREASIAQVVFTFVLTVAAAVLFFELQAISAECASAPTTPGGLPAWGPRLNPISALKKSLTDFWKIVAISLPAIALAVLAVYLLGKVQGYVGAAFKSATELQEYPMALLSRVPAASPKQPVQWSVAILTSGRYLILGVLLPLALIQLWLATVHEGLVLTVRSARTQILRAFGPQSVLTYMSGFVVFAVIPYLLLYRTTTTKHAWLEVALFVGRLGLVFGLTLFGWVVTMAALAVSRQEPPDDPGDFATQES